MISTTTIASPVGELTVGATERGVRYVLWENETRPIDIAVDAVGAVDAVDAVDGDGHGADPALAVRILDAVRTQLDEYFAGERTEFDLPLDPIGTPFQLSAWQVLRTIPYGSTMSYGEQARTLGDPNKARAVGAANGRNPISIIVPCHRVVGSNGSLTGFAGGIGAKAWLLDHERRVLATI
jgi:methylated-DNA-[protein]-cysteine S-methyltransferase